MKITRARVRNYKSIDDSSWVDLEDVTALVGKNESGKTAFLQALRKINSMAGDSDKFHIHDYPRKGYTKYKRIHNSDPCTVVQAEFQITAEEVEVIESNFGKGVLNSDKVIVNKNYNNERFWEVDVSQSPQPSSANLDSPESPGIVPPSFARSADQVEALPSNNHSPVALRIANDFLERWLPKFVYFDNYSTMKGKISISDLKIRTSEGAQLDDADRTFMSLLTLSGVSIEDLEEDLSYEDIKVELESASIAITDEIFEYWQQNRQLKVEFDLSQGDRRDPAPFNEGKILHVRIENARHRVTVAFDERSKGFVWFFSFLSYFSHLEETEEGDLVILLDEPGTALHAMAQKDFLRFMDERLAPQCQVLYTTHSPFMVDLKKLNRVRMVQDMDGVGTVVSHDAVGNDSETVFPLQMALGYQMAQTLFLSPHCLMVNSASDLIFLQTMGEMVSAMGAPRMDPRWVVVPVGSAENLPTFVSLLGDNYVSVAVMMDITPTNKARVERINKANVGADEGTVRWVEVTRVRDADIEDLFEPNFYLKLVNMAYANDLAKPITMKTISGSNPRIAERVSAYFSDAGIAGGEFDRYRPASYLLENFVEYRDEITDDTVDKFGSLIKRINGLLPSLSKTDVNGRGLKIDTVQEVASAIS